MLFFPKRLLLVKLDGAASDNVGLKPLHRQLSTSGAMISLLAFQNTFSRGSSAVKRVPDVSPECVFTVRDKNGAI